MKIMDIYFLGGIDMNKDLEFLKQSSEFESLNSGITITEQRLAKTHTCNKDNSIAVNVNFEYQLGLAHCEQEDSFQAKEHVNDRVVDEHLRHYYGSPYCDFETFVSMCEIWTHEVVSSELRRSVFNFRRYGNKNGYILIKSIDIGEIPSTPTFSTQQAKINFKSEFMLSCFGSLLGEQFGYIQESAGSIYNNVFPVPTRQTEQSSESSDVLLTYHTENCFHEIQPDYLVLLCLRQDRYGHARTCVASVRNILSKITKHTRTVLENPNFKFFSDYKENGKGDRNDIELIQSVLYGDLCDPYMRFDSAFMKPLNPSAEAAISELENAIAEVGCHIALEEGDMLLIDNKRSAHARTSFKANYDGTDRWLQRIFVSKDYISKSACLHNKKERVVTTFINGM
jgi:L-asparagine oxygenase